jgi:hypothetical protein
LLSGFGASQSIELSVEGFFMDETVNNVGSKTLFNPVFIDIATT